MAEEQEQKPTLENFLARVPLNDDMAQLMREVSQEDTEAAIETIEAPPDPFDPLRPLDDADRKALVKLTQDPGWEVFQRIRLRACAEAEKAATLLSQDNPLANAQRIAEGWAYMSVMRQVHKTETIRIQDEIAKLKPKRKRETQ